MMKLEDIEAKVFSQNGEDGIIGYLWQVLRYCDFTVVEMGAGDGRENNSRFFLESCHYRGVLFEKQARRAAGLRAMSRKRGWNATVRHETVGLDTDPVIWNPDVFSLDLDSYDFHVLRSLLHRQFRPQLAVVEYNAVLDPQAVTVPYGAECKPRLVYFGASLAAFRRLFDAFGYEFVTVCSAGINAFFLHRASIRDWACLDAVEWLPWADCEHLRKKCGSLEERRAIVAAKPLEEARP